MIVIVGASCYFALSCHRNLVFGVALEVEQAALSVLCVSAIGFFHSAEEVYVGHDLQ